MHPKMAILKKLPEDYMNLNMEMSYTNVRWQIRKEEEREEGIVYGGAAAKIKNLEEERRREEEEEMRDAQARQVFDPEKNSYDERKFRVTDMSECTRITLPKPLRVKREAEIEMRRDVHGRVSRSYRRDNCDTDGNQESNLTEQERRGLRSLGKRKSKGEIIIIQTDKSSKLCIMTREDYLKLGEDHVGKDENINYWGLISGQV